MTLMFSSASNVGALGTKFFSKALSSDSDGIRLTSPRHSSSSRAVSLTNSTSSTSIVSSSPNCLRSSGRVKKTLCKAYTMQCDEKMVHESPSERKTESVKGVPVFVMLPLDTVNFNGGLNRKRAMNASLMALKSAGVRGVMVDVWWGLVEKDGPMQYNWSGYRELVDMVASHGLELQAVMSFHQCGGNVGDSCNIPLPGWVLHEVNQNPDMVYTDKQGRRNYEYISLGCDTMPLLRGRSPIQVYADYMASFRDTFKDALGNVIVEIQVGMGPCGELRYPSYPESNGTWRFPGIGEFQCYDKVCCIMYLERDKLLRFLKDGHASMFINDMRHGYEWATIIEDKNAFDKALDKLIKDIKNNATPPYEKLDMYAQILDRKKVVWMEGPQGWTTWLVNRDDILS